MVGRPARSTPSFCETACVNSGPRIAAMKAPNAGPYCSTGRGKLPAWLTCGKSALIASMSEARTKCGTITKGKGSRVNAARRTASMSIGRSSAIASAIFAVDVRKLRRTGTQLRLAETIERYRGGVQVGMHVVGLFLNIEKSGQHLALVVMMLDIGHRRGAVGGIVVGTKLGELEIGAVMLLHQLDRAGFVIRLDLLAVDEEVEPVHRLIVFAHEVEALGRPGVIVELHARADHIEDGRALMRDGRLEQRHELLLVAREAPRHERRAQNEREADQIDRRIHVGAAGLGFRTLVGCRRELALGQAVDAVVLADIDHVHAAPNAVGELAKSDGGAVAVAGNAQIDQIAIG